MYIKQLKRNLKQKESALLIEQQKAEMKGERRRQRKAKSENHRDAFVGLCERAPQATRFHLRTDASLSRSQRSEELTLQQSIDKDALMGLFNIYVADIGRN